MPRQRDESMLIRAARMSYIEGLDQGTIAQHLGMSRSGVSRLLQAAREKGIVKITIVGDNYVSRDLTLETQIVQRFGLTSAAVVTDENSSVSLRHTGRLGAQIFDEYAPDATKIGISWGATIANLIDAIQPRELHPNSEIIPLVGGSSVFSLAPSGSTSVELLAYKCNAKSRRFDAPSIVESANTYRAIMSESTIQASLKLAKSCDLAFVGIGAFGYQTSRQVIDHMKLSPLEFSQVIAANPVGDVNGQFFDVLGRPLGKPINERVVGVTIEQLRAIDTVVGLAAGTEKAMGVLGALRTGAIDVLVTDAQLAKRLLVLERKHR